MRYLNWDVLLFPGSSRIPLQEFKTKCHVLPDQNNRLVDNAALNNNPYIGEFDSLSQIPVLTSFVSSLEPGSGFRVSVHSWETPKSSQILRTFKTADEAAAFEARIYIDGSMIAQRIFDGQTVWPEVIESLSNLDGLHPKPLRFPAFHPEILNQEYWAAGEIYGRIRVIIAEGVIAQVDNTKAKPAFDRLRDIVVFSFQHAPQDVLEKSDIAWPNPQMFRRGSRIIQRNIASRVMTLPNLEAHAHSPQRKCGIDISSKCLELSPPPLLLSMKSSKETSEHDDPFIDIIPISLRGKQGLTRSNNNETSTTYYNSFRTARSHTGTDMSGISYDKPDFERTINQAAIDEIVRALSPEKKRDLLQVLSPDKQLIKKDAEIYYRSGINTTAMPQEVRHLMSSGSWFPVESDFAKGHSTGALRGSLLASRFAPGPAATTQSEEQTYAGGLRKSLDRLLPNGWDKVLQSSGGFNPEAARPMVELRPRSSSNASKRKRQDSSATDTMTDPFNIASMSTSPVKHDETTPARSNCESPADGGVRLNKEG